MRCGDPRPPSALRHSGTSGCVREGIERMGNGTAPNPVVPAALTFSGR